MTTLHAIIEALLFVARQPISLDQLAKLIPDSSCKEIRESIEQLDLHFREEDRGLQIARFAGGYLLSTRPELSPWVERLGGQAQKTLSPAALETLAIIAYHQPITTPEIEFIRGVEARGVLRTLLQEHLICIRGRKKTIGRPLLYGTTKLFLERFGLNTLADLPSISEIEERSAPPASL